MAYQYRDDLKLLSRRLRINMTDAEQKLWYRIRRRQILDVQFYRQRPVLDYILDFFAPTVKLAIEVDGGQRFDAGKQATDHLRDSRLLQQQGITVLRFTNREIMQEMEEVLSVVYQYIEQKNRENVSKIPSPRYARRSPLEKGTSISSNPAAENQHTSSQPMASPRRASASPSTRPLCKGGRPA